MCVADDDSLFGGDDGPDARRGFLERNPGLLLDTRHFESQFVHDRLAALDDIGDKTDGRTRRRGCTRGCRVLRRASCGGVEWGGG